MAAIVPGNKQGAPFRTTDHRETPRGVDYSSGVRSHKATIVIPEGHDNEAFGCPYCLVK